jgi:hypothetical protein
MTHLFNAIRGVRHSLCQTFRDQEKVTAHTNLKNELTTQANTILSVVAED